MGKIWLVSDKIEMIEEIDSTYTAVYLTSGKKVIVKGDYNDVSARLVTEGKSFVW